MLTASRFRSKLLLGAYALVVASLSACSSGSNDDRASQRRPIDAYCPFVSNPQSFSNAMTVTGNAKYEYRIDGNGVIPNGTNAIVPSTVANGTTYSFTINSVPYSFTCTTNCTLISVVKQIVDGFSSNPIRGHGVSAVGFYRPSTTGAITIANLVNLNLVDARPIRFAEVRATNSSGGIIQCAETDASGNFSMSLPADGQRFTVSVLSRSANATNSGYIMNNPTDNQPYALNQTVETTSGTALNFRAPATGSLEGGAFNILDQIANSQAYLRTTTASCGSSFTGCQTFSVAPIVFTYWTPGLSPGVYYGVSGGISYYLNGNRELYILGGVNGDTTASDMDHFDNSVIIHEYGHFLEDQYGKPNSPGGSHNGDAIIDPRLAWGEGWANFFQAAVTGIPYYRDTKGYVNCGSGCSAVVSFNEPLESGTAYTMHDNPSVLGEGNFREFSVSRLLWAVRKASASGFAEIWSALNGTTSMRTASDSYKSISRLHVVQANSTGSGKTSWTTPQTNEKQQPNFTDYATRLVVSSSCSPTTVAMAIKKASGDNGSFSTSDQFNNNDFFYYEHGGGTLAVSVDWGGGDAADLDLYIYKPGYSFGDSDSSSMAASDARESSAASGNASVAPNLPAGAYMINVMAYTGLYYSLGTKNTTYSVKINGQTACPSAN